MDDIDAFHAAIYASPTDPLPRLAYADWLDDYGETAYAELIRVWHEVDRVPHPRRLRSAVRFRRHELVQQLRAAWRLDELQCDGERIDVGFVNGVLPDELSLTAGQLLVWQRWPPCLRPRRLRVRGYEGREQQVTACPYLGRVVELEFVQPEGDLFAPPYPPHSDPLLDALAQSNRLAALTHLRLDLWPSRRGLDRFAGSELVARLARFELGFALDGNAHEVYEYHDVTATQPPAGAIRVAILAFVDDFADRLPA